MSLCFSTGVAIDSQTKEKWANETQSGHEQTVCQMPQGRKKGRQTDEERNFSANLGLAMEDMAVCPLLFQLAKEKNIGTWLKL